MSFRSIVTGKRKRIALIAHDNMKRDILEWARFNKGTLSRHELYGTGTTGGMIENELTLPVTRFRSGPLNMQPRPRPCRLERPECPSEWSTRIPPVRP